MSTVFRPEYQECQKHKRLRRLYCETEGEAICKTCWDESHENHFVRAMKAYLQSLVHIEKNGFTLTDPSVFSNAQKKCWKHHEKDFTAIWIDEKAEAIDRSSPIRLDKLQKSNPNRRYGSKFSWIIQEEVEMTSRAQDDVQEAINYLNEVLQCVSDDKILTVLLKRAQTRTSLQKLANFRT